jgi:predicted esterase
MLIAAALLALAQAPLPTPSAQAAASALVHQPRIITLPDEAIAYIPASAGPRPPLLVVLHGAGRRADRMIERLAPNADERGIVLLAPTSRGITWDTVSLAEQPPSLDSALANARAKRFSSSRDADRVEAAIAALAKIVPVDRGRTALAGFSDGATFALAMGLSRAHAFSAVIAWSPGIAITTAGPARGRRVLISHGRRDSILRFEVTCAEIVPLVEDEGAVVSFMPFDGDHEAPPQVKDAFLDAVFGLVPGAPAHPLPAKVEKCMSRPNDPLRG